MTGEEKLKQLRQEIDAIDTEFVATFMRRMAVARKVAEVKCENNLAVMDAGREQQVVDRAMGLAEEDLKAETALMMRTIMSLSREYQHRLLFSRDIQLLPPARKRPEGKVVCAYQGVAGAWGQQAADTLFPDADKTAKDYFEDVFLAVKNGEADYGIVPIENSKTGAIGETYDLLRKYGCFIVGRTWITINQCLLGLKGSVVGDVREVLTHPEGLKQCRAFLENRGWLQTACRNTAVAAQIVAESGDIKKAAIGSPLAAQLYGLEVLHEDIMDATDNSTSFVVIAPQPEYDENSDHISITFSTLHRSGALCEALLPFLAENLNLMRIESRPSTMGQYRFFAEIQGSILDEKVAFALRQAAAASEYFEVLGCYKCTNG